VTLNVQFDTDKAVVKPKYNDEIGKVAEVLKRHPELKLTIEGHTDNVGSAQYNKSSPSGGPMPSRRCWSTVTASPPPAWRPWATA
jgi:hypothetical protein